MLIMSIPIAIVGLNFGRHIIENIVNGDAGKFVHLSAVCDIDAEKAKAFSEEFNVPFYTDIDDLLTNDEIPALGLFTGPVGRADLLRKIIKAGKDVMTTKPFEIDCAAGLQVLREAQEMGRIIHLNSPAPCLSPDLAIAQQWRKEYDLGIPVGCALSTWANYREKADGSWYDDPEKCPVPPIFRLGIYLINDLVAIFGEAEKVSVVSSRLLTGRPTADNAQLSILFKNGAVATIYASFCIEDGDHYRNSMTLNFERGTVYRNTGAQRQTVSGENKAEMSLVMGGNQTARNVVDEKLSNGMSGAYQWETFAKAVSGEEIDVYTTPENIIAGLRIIEAMAKAEKQGGVAQVEGV